MVTGVQSYGGAPWGAIPESMRAIGWGLVGLTLAVLTGCGRADPAESARPDSGTGSGGSGGRGGAAAKHAEMDAADPAMAETSMAQATAAGLAITDLVVGAGAEAKTGTAVTVHYRGVFPDGTEFDSSHKREKPFSFTLGAGEVVRGWDLGVRGMRVGGKRKLVVPPSLGYGEKPGARDMIFEIELLGVR